MNLESIGKNLKNENIWRRLIYIVVFALAFSAVEIVIWSLLIIQFLSQLFSGKPIERASAFSQGLAIYAYQIICFLTFQTDNTPWPFSAWPNNTINKSIVEIEGDNSETDE